MYVNSLLSHVLNIVYAAITIGETKPMEIVVRAIELKWLARCI